MSDSKDTAVEGQSEAQKHHHQSQSQPQPHSTLNQQSPPSSQESSPEEQKERQMSQETVKGDREASPRTSQEQDHGSTLEESADSTSALPSQQQPQSSANISNQVASDSALNSNGKDSEETKRIELLKRGGTCGEVPPMDHASHGTSENTDSMGSNHNHLPDSNPLPQRVSPPRSSQLSASPPTPTSRQASRIETISQPPASSSFNPAMTSRSIRLTKHAARKLLSETACPTCSQALHEPITLPCGHTECLSCIYSRIGAELPASSTKYENTRPDGSSRNSNLNPRSAGGASFTPKPPCSSHVPPRLPLTPATVPCPDQSCPRSTVGRGLGLWAGHQARYTSSLEDYPEVEEFDLQDATSVGPGKPPVDGFVVGLPSHTKRLQVIGAQPRSQAHSFASIPSTLNQSSCSGEQAEGSTSEGLRTDVTLAKAMAILRRYAGQPTPPASPLRRAQASIRRSLGLPGGAEYMARRGAGSGRAGRGGRHSGRPRPSISAYLRRSSVGGPRGPYLPSTRFNHPSAGRRRSLIATTGRREEDLESGTANGLRAVWDTDEDEGEGYDDDDEDEYGDAEKYQDGRTTDEDETMSYDEERESELDDFHAATDFDWPSGIGGAAARSSNSCQQLSPSSNPSGAVFPGSGRRGSDIHQSDLKRRRRNQKPNSSANVSSGSHGGRSSQRGRTGIRQVSETHYYAKGYDTVPSGLSVGEEDWDTEDGSTPGSEEGVEEERKSVSSKASVPLTRNLSSSSNEIDYNFHSRGQQQQQQQSQSQIQSQSHLDQMTATKLIDSGKVPLPTDGGIAALQSPQAGLAAMHAELVDVLECQLCYLVLYEPLTSPCGHTFCKTCLARSLDHSDRCPLCRSTLPNFAYFSEHPSNESLLKLLTSEIELPSEEEGSSSIHRQLNSLYGPHSNSSFSGLPFPTSDNEEKTEEKKPNTWGLKPLSEERKAAVEQEERENRLSTPIFVCTLAFPNMPTVLHVFEPRYRLMIRRCLESGNPRFGMVLPSRNMSGPTPGVSQYGTMLEIRSVQMLADGRSMIETVGSYRFKLLDKGALDGYTVGHIERFDDISPEEEAEIEAAALRRNQELDARVSNSTTSTDSANASTSGDANGSSTSSTTEPESPRMPGAAPASLLPSSTSTTSSTAETEREQTTEELIATCVSFIETIKSGSAPWLMTRLNSTYGPMPEPHEVEKFGYWIASVMPIDEHEKAKLLPIRSPRLRLRLVVHWIEQLRRSWWFNGGCTVS